MWMMKIEVKDENETTFATMVKCEENPTMEVVEDMNANIVNVEFYVELAFLEEWLAKPKYDGDESGYGKFVITAAKEEPDKEETIRVVEAIMTVEEEMKENEDVFDLTEVDKNVKSTITEVQEDA
jgi:hypothetical protein